MRAATAVELDGFTREACTIRGRTKSVYRAGEGPTVLVIAEMPGITPLVLDFARRVRDLGCTVVLPHLFGTPGRPASPGYLVSTLSRVCISREFTLLAVGRSSPVIAWLRQLAAREHERCGGPGVGAVGMCLTGGFALAMMVEDSVVAPVLSQPSLPVPLGLARRRDLGLTPSEIQRVQERAAAGVCVLGLRFSGDRMAPPERFEALRAMLGERFVGVELDSSPGNPYGHPRQAHSVLTDELQDRPGTPTRAALDQVLDLFRRRLLEEPAAEEPAARGEADG